ncbi:MAG TPA: transglycosylase SLT domain-containing protein [Ktedonobacteraceae bacterium]|jgi:LysM repeat protein|nr:transglycosylase SLT domain-containing protein [Ktedonobacteraceae bacterium]
MRIRESMKAFSHNVRHLRLQGLPLAARHLLILAMLVVTLAGGAIGGHLLGVFAQGSCASGDQGYSVRWGDTLSGIALRYHTTWQKLASYNHLANPNLIYPYQTICIPGNGSGGSGYGSGSGGFLPKSQYVAIARQDASNAGISPNLFVRQINQESGFNPWAVSPAGAIGIAQFMPATAASMGINPHDPIQSLRAAARLMASYAYQYGNYAKALGAYNAGPGTVNWAVSVGGANWFNYLPYETRNYIDVIMGW